MQKALMVEENVLGEDFFILSGHVNGSAVHLPTSIKKLWLMLF